MNDKANDRNKASANVQNQAAKPSPAANMRSAGPSPESGLLSKISGRFNTALQTNRGGSGGMPVTSTPTAAPRPTEEVSIARIRGNKTQKMYIPEGVVIEGSITGGSETEIHGRVEGNVSVDSTLLLGKSSLVNGNVRAGSCQVEGTVKGGIECAD